LVDKVAITHGFIAEPRRGHAMTLEEALNVVEKPFHATGYKCALPHRQGVLQRISPGAGILCDTTHMQQRGEIERVKIALRRVMERKGIKAKPLAKSAGLGETAVRDFFERENADMKLSTLHKLAGALDVPIDDLLAGASVQIVGRIGAGGSVIFEEVEYGLVPRPPGVDVTLEALEVQGDSMLPRYSSGDVLYIAKDQAGVQPEDVGDYCAVRLVTGETYVKILGYGSRPGLFTLRSLNAEDIIDVELEWATPIIFVLPRAARRRLGV
jgi:repressor LexA